MFPTRLLKLLKERPSKPHILTRVGSTFQRPTRITAAEAYLPKFKFSSRPSSESQKGKEKGNQTSSEPLLHTQKPNILGGMLSKTAVVMLMGLLGMVYQATQLPPPETTAGLVENPDVSRIRLRDGRYLAYREKGVPKNEAKYKIIIIHGFGGSKEMNFHVPQELMDELGIYILSFDRAGYGESDPNPKRSVKSEALDIEELADQLQLGSKFYTIGVSMGSYPSWSCLKYIPDRLAGVALVAPVVNYWWPSLPAYLTKNDHRKTFLRFSSWVARHAPKLLKWWVTKIWFPSSSSLEGSSVFFSNHDMVVLKETSGLPMLTQDRLRQRGVFETLRHDYMAAFGNWGFDPLTLSNPFPQNESSVHIWQGFQDKVVPVQLQRYIIGRLPWIRYHEVPDGGHLIVHYKGLCEAILRSLLLGEELALYRPSTEKIIS